MAFDQKNRIASVNTPFGEGAVGLLSLEGTETLGRLPTFELELISEKKSLDPKQILGQPVGVTLHLGNGKQRYFHGHAVQFGRAMVLNRYFAYKVKVVPWVWLVTRSRDCLVFQNKQGVDSVQK